jgi:PIN domain nuclease of toxin-antitoxin system
MKILIDTHILLWFLEGDNQKISNAALNSITDKENEKFISIASLWEIAIKVNIGKLPLRSTFPKFLNLISANGFEVLEIKYNHLIEYLSLPMHHRDPFDRILIAQSVQEGFQVITKDPNLSSYKIKTIW